MDGTVAPRFLIINADDFGLSPGVTDAIVDLARRGAVTSTSALVTLPTSDEALATARALSLDVGLHLTLSAGMPLSPPHTIPTLLAGRPRPGSPFASAHVIQWRCLTGRLKLDEVAREWSAQIERCLALGLIPSHLDSHCHLHALPRLYPLAVRLSARYGIPGLRRAGSNVILRPPGLPLLSCTVGRARRRVALYQPDYLSVLTVMGPARTPRPLHALLHGLPAGVTELVCHPGYVDAALQRLDPLTAPREREWLLLSRPHLAEALTREGIRLVSWQTMTSRRVSVVEATENRAGLQQP